MHIGYFTSKYPYPKHQIGNKYDYGGSVIATYSLVQEMQKLPCNITIFTSSYNNQDSVERVQNYNVYRYATYGNFLSANIAPGLYTKPKLNEIGLVHTSFDIPPAPLAGFNFSKKQNIPLIITYHGDWDDGYGSLLRKVGVKVNNILLTNRVLSHAKVIISPSEIYVKRSKFLKQHSNKVAVIPNGVNLEQFNIHKSKTECRELLHLPIEPKIILFFGYLSPYKGPDVLVNAMSKILEENSNVILVFAGRGVMKDELQRLVHKEKIQEHVMFSGFIKEELKPLYYVASDIFCLPSSMTTECYPLAIMEAMASGLPIVASNIGGIPEIVINGETGLLVNPRDINDLKEKLLLLIENEDSAKIMGISGKEKIRNYSWEKIASLTKTVYEDFI